jgi:tetratricopeptide (TPR) repeat protein
MNHLKISVLVRVLAPAFLSLCLTSAVLAQMDLGPAQMGAIDSHPGDSIRGASAANIYVSVREPNGLPVTESATVKLSCPLKGVSLSGPTKDTALAQFQNIPAGDCIVDVTATGYKPAHERALVADSLAARNQYVYVYLHLESENTAVSARAQVSLNVLREMDKGTEAMRKNHFDEARKHYLKAKQSAPQNPDIEYLLGTLDLTQKNAEAAKSHYERAISLAPSHEHALQALGEIQLQSHEVPQAVSTLQRAVQANTASYRAQFYLAAALLQQRDYVAAQMHAERAIKLAPDKLPMAHVLLGEILSEDGKREEARHELELVVQKFPNDSAAAAAKTDIADLEKPLAAAPEVKTKSTSAALAAMEKPANSVLPADIAEGPSRPWGPLDVDSIKPGVAGDVTCSAAEVVARTGETSTRELETFEKFIAKEHIEHEEVDRNGKSGPVKSRDFSYLIFVDHDKSGQVFLQESRDGGTGTDSFPTSLATMGLMGLGVDVFHPGFARALDFTCEGLGQWRGKAAYLMYFKQKPGQKSYLRLWETQRQTVEIPLRGRVWVAASDYQVLHVETDLVEPMKELELTRDHLAIDYGPVPFQGGKSELWLPWYADMYLELHHHRYHHRHVLSNYAMFGVDTNNIINKPKNIDGPDSPQKPN